MPVPLNAATEITRTFLTKCLGYLVDDSIPFRGPKGAASDLDFLAVRPHNPPMLLIPDGRRISLEERLLIEVKGMWEYSQTSIFSDLSKDLALIDPSTHVVPEAKWSHPDFWLSVLSERAYKVASEHFGTKNFQ